MSFVQAWCSSATDFGSDVGSEWTDLTNVTGEPDGILASASLPGTIPAYAGMAMSFDLSALPTNVRILAVSSEVWVSAVDVGTSLGNLSIGLGDPLAWSVGAPLLPVINDGVVRMFEWATLGHYWIPAIADQALWGFSGIRTSDLIAGRFALQCGFVAGDPVPGTVHIDAARITVVYEQLSQPGGDRGRRRWQRGHRGMRR